jgi:histidinol-phosphate aminotransferase
MQLNILEKTSINHQPLIRLNTNENPLGAPPLSSQKLASTYHALHRYPDPHQEKLRSRLGEYFGISKKNIICGNGSDELILLLVNILLKQNDYAIFLENDYFIYKHVLNIYSKQYKEINYSIGENRVKCLLHQLDDTCKLLFISNPSNPFGIYNNQLDIVELLEAAKQTGTLVILDEAYNHFVDAQDYPNSIALLKQFKNLMILRTFSKAYGLAGIRLGCLLADHSIIDSIMKNKLPFNVNMLAQFTVIEALKDKQHLIASKSIIQKEKTYFYNKLNTLGVDYLPSQTNFVLVKIQHASDDFYTFMLNRGVLINPLNEYTLPQFFRVSMGRHDQNEIFFQLLEKFLRLHSHKHTA